MDEGRLAVVVRQEERHRKYVYVMNDIVRARLGLYTNCLVREQHESSVKLLKNCSEMRKAVMRQKVLRQCLEMRKRRIVDRDPVRPYGQYGGKPLRSLTRDVDRVIADHHPRVRRLRRVEEAMRRSLENGAILDQESVARRIDTFFQLRQAEQQQQQQQQQQQRQRGKGQSSSRRAQDEAVLLPGRRVLRRRSVVKPSSWAEAASEDASVAREGGVPSELSLKPEPSEAAKGSNSSRLNLDSPNIHSKESAGKVSCAKEALGKDLNNSHNHGHSDTVGVNNNNTVSLDVDSKGRLRGIRTNLAHTNDAEEQEERMLTATHRKPQKASQGAKTQERGSPTRTGRAEHTGRVAAAGAGAGAAGASREEEDGGDDGWQSNSAQDRTSHQRRRSSEEKPRSKLILPPIEPTKALVSKH